MDKSKKDVDWTKVEQCAAAILVSSKCTGYSETQDATWNNRTPHHKRNKSSIWGTLGMFLTPDPNHFISNSYKETTHARSR